MEIGTALTTHYTFPLALHLQSIRCVLTERWKNLSWVHLDVSQEALNQTMSQIIYNLTSSEHKYLPFHVHQGFNCNFMKITSEWWRKCWSRSSVMMLNTRRDDVEPKSCVQHHRACIMYCRERTSRRETVWNKNIIFVFFEQKVFLCLRKITVEPLMLHGLFYRSLCYVSGQGDISVVLLYMEALKALRFKQKHLNLCSDDERKSYGFGTTSGWVINDIIFIFWVN